METARYLRILSGALLACCALLAPSTSAQSVSDPDAAQMPPPAPRSSAAVRKLAPAELVAELKRGGYVIYFRHTSTDFSQNDLQSKGFTDCAHQRNLTDGGRAQARAIGEAIRSLKLPIAKVLASPLCRTMETARLITGRAAASRDVRGYATRGGKPDYSALERLLATPPAAGTLRIVASHGNPFIAIAGSPRLDEGEAAVIRGDGKRWTIVARIKVAEWAALAQGAGNKKGP